MFLCSLHVFDGTISPVVVVLSQVAELVPLFLQLLHLELGVTQKVLGDIELLRGLLKFVLSKVELVLGLREGVLEFLMGILQLGKSLLQCCQAISGVIIVSLDLSICVLRLFEEPVEHLAGSFGLHRLEICLQGLLHLLKWEKLLIEKLSARLISTDGELNVVFDVLQPVRDAREVYCWRHIGLGLLQDLPAVYELIIVLIQALHVTKDLLFEKLIFELLVLEVLDDLQQRLYRYPQLTLSEVLTLLLPHVIAGKGGCLVLHRIK